jgi:hypothetical protein
MNVSITGEDYKAERDEPSLLSLKDETQLEKRVATRRIF